MTAPRDLPHSDVPASSERAKAPLSFRNHRLDTDIPAVWLDALLATAGDLPVEEGREAVARAMLEALSSLLPAHGLGIHLPRTEDRPPLLLRLGSGSGDEEAFPPTRLFPSVRYEHIAVCDETLACTLHAAHDDAGRVATGSAETLLVTRAARLLGAALRHADALELAHERERQLSHLSAEMVQTSKLASLGELAAGVVHELNNPLTSIVAYSDYLRKKGEQAQSDAEDLERLRRISEAADRILRFSRDLGTYARPSSGVVTLLRVGEVIDRARIFCDHVLANAGAKLTVDVPAVVPPLRGVGSELTQVFVNLLTNACHAVPEEGGQVTVRAQVEAGFVEIEVSDNGHGIDSRVLPRIFDPFFTTKAVGRGTGLGLSISRNIVLRHGGTIEAQSSKAGARFRVRLPLAATVEGETMPPPVAP